MALSFLLPKVSWLSLGARSSLGLLGARGSHMVDALAEGALLGPGWQFSFLGVMV